LLTLACKFIVVGTIIARSFGNHKHVIVVKKTIFDVFGNYNVYCPEWMKKGSKGGTPTCGQITSLQKTSWDSSTGAVVSIVKNENLLPATIGVFGDWGGGKSTLIEIVRTQLTTEEEKKAGTVVLSFNGWLFEGYEGAKTALMGTILEELQEHETFKNKASGKAKKLPQEPVPTSGLDEEHSGRRETCGCSLRWSCGSGIADRWRRRYRQRS
jgi:KAP family P-loop domain